MSQAPGLRDVCEHQAAGGGLRQRVSLQRDLCRQLHAAPGPAALGEHGTQSLRVQTRDVDTVRWRLPTGSQALCIRINASRPATWFDGMLEANEAFFKAHGGLGCAANLEMPVTNYSGSWKMKMQLCAAQLMNCIVFA